MSVAASSAVVTVALIGNPNTGKSTLFNALCGLRQRVGNYPGVTVEKKIGRYEATGRKFSVIDLPGTYSLAPRSPDEMIAVDVLLGRRDDVHAPDVVLCIVDASNLERHLYLVSQVLELGLSTVIALNMMDVARERGIQIDAHRLSARLDVPVIPLEANRGLGMTELRDALNAAVGNKAVAPASPFPPAFQEEVEQLGKELRQSCGHEKPWPRYLVERVLLDVGGYVTKLHMPGETSSTASHITAARERLTAAGCPVPAIEPVVRYGWVAQMLEGVIRRPKSRPLTTSDRIDKVLTHKVGGSLIFILLMALMFAAVFLIAPPSAEFIDWISGILNDQIASVVPKGALRSLLSNGIVAGIGGILVFLPQIFVLFLFIGVLEDCGYMARAAYLMDKLMSRVGLSGKSFIPMLSSFACAIPGIMATRVIENRRDRLVTMLVAPLMSCSARLPVYILLVYTFIPGFFWQVGTMVGMYFVGILVAVAVAFVLKRTILRGATPPFVMELPAYKFPSPKLVLRRMLENGWEFVYRAGTVILAATILIWALGYFPQRDADLDPALLARKKQADEKVAALEAEKDQANLEIAKEQQQEVDYEVDAVRLRSSYLGQMGQWIEPAVRPLGWDWRIGCAAIASFPAREVMVSSLGVIFQLGEDQDENSVPLKNSLQRATWDGTNRKLFNIPVALSLMVFIALCSQCASTLAVVKRETNTWRWPIFMFVYMTVLAYVGALVTYQVGIRLIGGV